MLHPTRTVDVKQHCLLACIVWLGSFACFLQSAPPAAPVCLLKREHVLELPGHQDVACFEGLSKHAHLCNAPRTRCTCRASPLRGAAFPFSYMEPGKNKDVIRPYVTNNFPIEQISPIGKISSQSQIAYHRALKHKLLTAALQCYGEPACWYLAMCSGHADQPWFRLADIPFPPAPPACCAGNSPVMLHKDNLSAIAEPWYDLSLR